MFVAKCKLSAFRCLNSTSKLNIPTRDRRCRLKLSKDSKEWDFEVDCPPQYNVIQESKTNSPPSLFELSKRLVYEKISEAAKEMSKDSYSIYSDIKLYRHDSENNNVVELHNNLNSNNINNNNFNTNGTNTKRKDYLVPKDIIEDGMNVIPNFIKEDLVNGPVSRCENAKCRKPVFDHVYYEFTFG